MTEFSQSLMLPIVGSWDQNARRKALKVLCDGLNHCGSPGRGHHTSPISRMRKVRLRKGAVSGEIRHLLIASCVLGFVNTVCQGTLRE